MKFPFSRRPATSGDSTSPSTTTASSSETDLDALILAGNALEDAGDVAAALTLYTRAADGRPEFWRAHLNRGNALRLLKRHGEAEAAYRRSIDLNPDAAGAHLNLGNLLLTDPTQTASAIGSYRAATRLLPNWSKAWLGLACAFEAAAEVEQAIAACEKALELEPLLANAATLLARILRKRGDSLRAASLLSTLREQLPDDSHLLLEQAELYKQAGESEAAAEAYRHLLAGTTTDWESWSAYLFALNLVPGRSAKNLLAEHVQFGKALEKVVPAAHPHARFRHRKPLKIGYVSADFRRHSVSCFMEPLLRYHDRAEVEVYCYYNDTAQDDITRRFIELADHWRNIATLDDLEVTRRIVGDEIDILIDLSGHTSGNRLGVFARRPAPLQATWLGYLATTGLKTIDLRICDFHTDPVDAEQWQTETPVRLPNSQWCYQPQVAIPDPGDLPYLTNGYWTFGSFNQSSKLNGPLLRDWARLLANVPNSRLRIVGVGDNFAEQRIRDIFAAALITDDRLELIGRMPIDTYFSTYRNVDFALDSFPYNGATTTCDALVMGVPVLSVAGDRSISRSGLSLLTTLELQDWVAPAPDALAVTLQQLAANPERIAMLRKELPQRMRSSALMDGPLFAASLEAALRGVWEQRRSLSV